MDLSWRRNLVADFGGELAAYEALQAFYKEREDLLASLARPPPFDADTHETRLRLWTLMGVIEHDMRLIDLIAIRDVHRRQQTYPEDF